MAVNPNILQQRDAFGIGDIYGFFPTGDVKFEMTYTTTDFSYAFFANPSNRIKVDVSFASDELPQDG